MADPQRAHQVADHEVRVQAEQRVRQQDLVADPAPERGRQPRQGSAHQAPVGRERLDSLLEVHRRADGVGVGRVVLPAQVVGQARELGMDHRAVEALGEVLDDQLPVRPHLVGHRVGGPEVGQAPDAHAGAGRTQLLLKVRSLLRDPDEDDAAPLLAPGLGEPKVGDREPLHLVHVGCGAKLSVEPVGPGVIGTLDRARQTPLLRFQQPRPAVAAHVVVRPHRPLLIPHQDHRVPGDLDQAVVPGLGQFFHRTARVPHHPVDPLALALEDRRIAVVAGGQRPGLRRNAPRRGARRGGRHSPAAGVARFRGGSKNGSGATRDRARRRVYSTVTSMSSGVPGHS